MLCSRWNRGVCWFSLTSGGKFRQLFPNPQAVLDCLVQCSMVAQLCLQPSTFLKKEDLDLGEISKHKQQYD